MMVESGRPRTSYWREFARLREEYSEFVWSHRQGMRGATARQAEALALELAHRLDEEAEVFRTQARTWADVINHPPSGERR